MGEQAKMIVLSLEEEEEEEEGEEMRDTNNLRHGTCRQRQSHPEKGGGRVKGRRGGRFERKKRFEFARI